MVYPHTDESSEVDNEMSAWQPKLAGDILGWPERNLDFAL